MYVGCADPADVYPEPVTMDERLKRWQLVAVVTVCVARHELVRRQTAAASGSDGRRTHPVVFTVPL